MFTLTTRFLSTLALCLLVVATALGQGVTTASMNGRITDESGEPLIGANILAVHVPSGSTYGNATDVDGFYRIPGMRVGGPYTVRVSYTGYEEFVQENVYLSLGQSYRLSPELSETALELGEVEVTALRNDVFDGNRTGQETVVTERLINDIPTITRAIGDYARFNPLASIDENTDGFTISLAGQNNRYNTIYIDGAVNNDAFGLAGSGTNGGQTGVQPISIDAIEQFTISVAPFDVRQSGFAGGAINAVTRSGTNEFEGSAYYFLRNEDLAGETPVEDGSDQERMKLADFTAQTYGFRLGGPIVQDKLFFFVNAELQRDETPQPFDFTNYRGDATLDDVNRLVSAFQERYGYDLGSYDNNTSFLDSEKFLAKIDWNINDIHKLSVRHSYVGADNLEARRSAPFDLRFINGSEFFASNTNSSALELNSIFGSNISNKLTVGLTIVRDDRDPDGEPFPAVTIEDADAEITLGAETFSTANLLNQDIFTINNDFSIYKGRHSLLFGVNFEYFNAGNLFIRDNFGAYTWADDNDNNITGLDKFFDEMPADRYQRSFSLVDDVTGDESNAIAEFQQMLLGIYVQDEYQATDNLKLTGGLRIDIPFWPDEQPVNEQFNNETIPAIEEAYSGIFDDPLQGARTGEFIDPQVLFSPRLGFNWDITGDQQTQLRGGIGIFTSRIPLVWPGGAYNNYGLNIGGTGGSDIALVPDVNKQPLQPDLENVEPSGQIDLFAADFKLPQVGKINLALDQKLPGGIVATLEGLFTDYINNIRYQNLNLRPSVRNLTGSPDDRPLFEGADPNFGDDVIDDNYNYIMLASNTDEGYAYNVALSLSKPFTNGFTANVAYSYGDAYTLFDATSSQNNSQWRGFYNVNGRNFETDAMRSTFAAQHRVFGQLSYEVDYLDFAKSKLSVNFNGQTGRSFSYVVGAANFLFIDDGGFSNNELIYVPANQNEIPLVDITNNDGDVIYTAAEQWQALDAFISNNDDLNDRRGDYAERNSANNPFEFTIDLRFLQDFYVETGDGKRNTLQLSIDIFNFTNLLNESWGLRRFSGSFGNYPLIFLDNVTLGSNTTPEYTVNEQIIEGEDPWDGNLDDSGFRSSRWQMQVGLRYIFGGR